MQGARIDHQRVHDARMEKRMKDKNKDKAVEATQAETEADPAQAVIEELLATWAGAFDAYWAGRGAAGRASLAATQFPAFTDPHLWDVIATMPEPARARTVDAIASLVAADEAGASTYGAVMEGRAPSLACLIAVRLARPARQVPTASKVIKTAAVPAGIRAMLARL